MLIAAEITSGLQCIFSLSIIVKKYNNMKNLEVDFLILNVNVNNQTISTIKKILETCNFKYKILDLRNPNKIINKHNNSNYDILILRSRIQVKVHNNFCISNNFFKTIGNCKNSKLIHKYFHYKKLYTVDDGLSNWLLDSKYRFINLVFSNFFPGTIKNNRFIIPKLLKQFLSNKLYITHFSIFSTYKKYNIDLEFKDLLKKINSKLIKKNDLNVKNLYIGIWPNFDDRSNNQNEDKQLLYLNEFINQNENFKNEIIYVKDHPKFKLKDNLIKDNFIRIDKEYLQYPLEILLPSFPNLENIIGFPSTALKLASYLYRSKNLIHILYKKNDKTYFNDRLNIFFNNSKNTRIFEILNLIN